MTQRGKYRNEESQDLLDKIKELERRIGALERTPQMGAQTIDRGDMIVKDGLVIVQDADGVARVRMGKLPSGDYGLETFDAQNNQYITSPVIASDFKALFGNTSSAAYADLTEFTGPQVTVTVRASGRLTVFGIAQYQPVAPKTSVQAGQISIALSGANTLAAGATGSPFYSLEQLQVVPSSGTIQQLMAAPVVTAATLTGLNPGVTTLTMKYLSVFGDAIQFIFPSLVVIVH